MNWIPYDGKHEVPSNGDKVLITLRWADGDYTVTTGEYWHIANSEHEKRFGNWDRFVTAWMPMPKPYKDGE